jgi:peptidoglycan/xylan/chitin deacetylase (PgdA/CDA1 family)
MPSLCRGHFLFWGKNKMRRIVYIAVMMFFLPLMAFSNSVIAQPNDKLPAGYIEVVRDSKIYAQVGGHFIQVGIFKNGQNIFATPHKGKEGKYYAFKFGNGEGYIAGNNVKKIKAPEFINNLPNARNKNAQGLVILKDIKVYRIPMSDNKPIATLSANLRYPLLHKLKDTDHHIWYEINLGGRKGYISAEDAEIDNGIPVITYHHILEDKENKKFRHTSTTTSQVAFREQMDYLKQAGYTTISMYELEGYLKRNINLPAKAVVLTFDDGLKSVYKYAYPVLKKNKQQATFFIITSRIKRHPQKWDPNSLQFLSVPELYAIKDVFDFQSHTHFLHRLVNRKPILLSRSYHNILFDFKHSHRALSQFNRHVYYLSYPFGGYNKIAMEAANDAGFHLAVTTKKGKVKLGDNPFALKRTYIFRTDSIEKLARVVANNS